MSENTKYNVIGGVLVLAALVVGAIVGMSATGSESSDPVDRDRGELGNVSVNETKDVFINGLQLGGQTEYWSDTFTIGTADNNDGWQNLTGKTVYVDRVDVEIVDGAASSTMVFDVATSSSENLSDTSDPYSEFIDSQAISTSTPAGRVLNTIADSGTNGTGVVQVDDQEYVSLRFLQGNTSGTTALGSCSSGVCETATSTNRGFNVDWRLHYYFEGEN